MKLIHIVGARPQFIKMAAVSRAIAKHNKQVAQHGNIDEFIIHSGQHYDYELSEVFFYELDIPKPNYNLGVGSGGHGEQTGEMLKRLEPILLEEHPDIVLVYGDTNSTLAGALAGAKLHIPVAHLESGLRSFNRRMPEEINRILTDHASEVLFCPTQTAVRNLEKEGFTNIANNGHLLSDSASDLALAVNHELRTAHHAPLVLNVGDVMYDSVLYNLKLAEEQSNILKRLNLQRNKPNEVNEPYELNKPVPYALATVHRAENTDDPECLHSILEALQEVARDVMPVIIPLHPRTQKAMQHSFTNYELRTIHSTLNVIQPISYLDMLLLEKNADLILTDSGGVQKEAFILRKPCITLRDETEWTETVESGWNTVTGASPERILEAVESYKRLRPTKPAIDPYGDGHSAERIVSMLVERNLDKKQLIY